MTEKRTPCILLVDSEPKWSQAAKYTLEQHGKYKVESVTNLQSALNSSYCDGFDLILINAALAFGEDVSKFEEIVRLYRDKVLVIADVGSISAAIKVFKMGADYVEKPFEPKRVIELVRSHLQQIRPATT